MEYKLLISRKRKVFVGIGELVICQRVLDGASCLILFLKIYCFDTGDLA